MANSGRSRNPARQQTWKLLANDCQAGSPVHGFFGTLPEALRSPALKKLTSFTMPNHSSGKSAFNSLTETTDDKERKTARWW
jgi:hypothetical protein